MIFLGKKKKATSVKVLPSGYLYEVEPGQTVLQAALEAGLQYPHDCRRGTCSKCKTQLLEGEIKEQTDFSYTLNDDEMRNGLILACAAQPKSPLVIKVDLVSDQRTLGCTSCQGTVVRYKHLTSDILEVGIRVGKSLPRSDDPCGKCAPYVAGQYADISIPGISRSRSYSFATAKENENADEVSFLIQHVQGGEMSGWFHTEDRTGEKIGLSGPYGAFYLREGDSPILCIAGGSGMSSINALLEHAYNHRVERNVVFLFGAKTQEDLFYLDRMHRLKSKWPKKFSFDFVPVLSNEPSTTNWSGLRGLVTDHIKGLKLDLSSSQVYLSGSPEMIDATVQVLEDNDVSDDMMFFDRFLNSSHTASI